MKILVINAGSSSLKYKLFDMTNRSALASGVFERIGDGQGISTYAKFTGNGVTKIARKLTIKDHKHSIYLAMEYLADSEMGAIKAIEDIEAIGHRVVQGGESFSSATLINEDVKQAIRDNIPLAPLHNPSNLVGIEVAEALMPGIPNVAVFDTEFHQTMPPKAFMYALPYVYYRNFKVRRYGFHGTSHKYVANQAARIMGKCKDQVNLITIHLGNGCSISAIGKGVCKDTSMGMTPLAGVMMGTRVGDIDPAIIRYLIQQTGMDIHTLDGILNSQSGFKGICGYNDMRDIHKACSNDDNLGALALDMFCYQIKKYIGAYIAALGGIDALVFTAGIGENDAVVREKVCKNLHFLGIVLDSDRNKTPKEGTFPIHSCKSPVQVWVIPTNEELQIAIETQDNIMT